MSVIDVSMMWSKAGGKFTSERFNPFSDKFTISEAYAVQAEIGDNAVTIEETLGSMGLPNYGDRHVSGRNAFVNDINITPFNSPIFWVVEVNYDGIDFDTGPVDVEWTDNSTSEPTDRDWNGIPILTAAGEQVEGLTVEIADQVCVIRRKFIFINTYAIAAYRRSVNSDTFLGWPPGTARLVGYSAKNSFKFGVTLEMWDVTARIHFKQPYANTTTEQAWYNRWRHEGLYINAVPNDPTTWQRARDAMGEEVSKPVLLKLDGTQETDPNLAVYKHSQVYDSLPYSLLGLT